MRNALVRNKVTEKDISRWLEKHGYEGIRFEEVELHAIKSPGWLQVFRFTVRARSQDDARVTLFGAARDDERYKRFEVEAFETVDEQTLLLEQWSEGLIRARSSDRSKNSVKFNDPNAASEQPLINDFWIRILFGLFMVLLLLLFALLFKMTS